MTTTALTSSRARRFLKVRGVVQGVGFRPAVYRLAVEQGLSGFVRNETDGVVIEIEGDEGAVASFDQTLRRGLPVAARVDAIESRPLPANDERGFRVSASIAAEGRGETGVPADRATCDDCLRELFDPANRRHHYPFITCTNCGPRYTIVRALPWDRSRTTMAAFTMCALCRDEYENPMDRRFHSETNACADCGPRVAGGAEAIAEAVRRLVAGDIVAVKGIGGFHLAADARNEDAVKRLRRRKNRPFKPFAVMARDLETAGGFARIDAIAREALLDAARPIVCLPEREKLAPSVAPRLDEIGVMLPYAPLHHLLLAFGPAALVMTSGNRGGEPIVTDDEEARGTLREIADAFLVHDRIIHARVDDSVVRVMASRPRPVRRSRGMVPDSITIPFAPAPVLAVGAELKNTVCAAREDRASLSPHIGDLSHPLSFTFFEQTITAMTDLAGPPAVVAHDLHPDYRSTRWAMQSGMPRIAVQHHHAHIASCLADNGRSGRVAGVAFDGTGCGPGGELWGGEILLCDVETFSRAGHLRPIALAGGEAAIREPWRLAVAALLDAGERLDILERIGSARLAAIRTLIERGVRAPAATSAGRWFDAVAAMCGVCDEVTYEGQAAMELESAAAASGEPYEFAIEAGNEIDLRPMVRAIAGDVRGSVPPSIIAARFHETLARSVAAVCARLPPRTAALSGGCFQNRRLTERLKDVLEQQGFEVLLHRRVPANDGGVSLGQAAVAASRMRGSVS